jgi:hypothetical protein
VRDRQRGPGRDAATAPQPHRADPRLRALLAESVARGDQLGLDPALVLDELELSRIGPAGPRTAGAHGGLAPHALGVDPVSVEEHADALHRALTMPAGERAERARAMRERASAGDPAAWLRAQLEDAAAWRAAAGGAW